MSFAKSGKILMGIIAPDKTDMRAEFRIHMPKLSSKKNELTEIVNINP